MTLQSYPPDELDRLALRLFDLAATMREMALSCRENDIEAAPLHDKKALEWIAKLEDWAQKGVADLRIQTVRQQAAKRAAAIQESTSATTEPKAASRHNTT